MTTETLEVEEKIDYPSLIAQQKELIITLARQWLYKSSGETSRELAGAVHKLNMLEREEKNEKKNARRRKK